jgi:hypothetical protein
MFTKTTFSMLGCKGVEEELKKMENVKSVVIFGVMVSILFLIVQYFSSQII